MKDVNTIIGTLPGTTKAAGDLKKDLKCELVLLPITKIGADQDEFRTGINTMAKFADAIWSVGPDLFSHFHDIFEEDGDHKLLSKHKQILLKPDESTINYLSYYHSAQIRKFISLWTHESTLTYKGRNTTSKGSNLQNFVAFGSALGDINKHKLLQKEPQIQWHVHGLKKEEQVSAAIEKQAKGHNVGLQSLIEAKCLDDVKLRNCLAFIVPDVYEETFNFVAIAAFYNGLPTLVLSKSSIGQWLQTLQCADTAHALVTLTGNIETDKEIWTEKLYKEILNHDASPMEWAKRLSEFLQNTSGLFTLDLLVSTRGKETESAKGKQSALSRSHKEIPVRIYSFLQKLTVAKNVLYFFEILDMGNR